MKIYDQSQSRRVALKLKEFVAAAQEIVQREVDKIPAAKMTEILGKLAAARDSGGVKVDMTEFTTPADREINKLISRHMFHHSLLEDIERYHKGQAIHDILSRSDYNLLKILGSDLEETAGYVFAGKKPEEVFAKSESAEVVTQIHAWRELKALTEVYHEAGRRLTPNASYYPTEEVLGFVEAQEAELLRKRSPDAPRPGIDYDLV